MTSIFEIYFTLGKFGQALTVLIAMLSLFIAVLVTTSFHPVIALFLLISLYVLTAVLFLHLGLTLFTLLYIIIYVGAISVLFLFVIMMLNIRTISFVSFFKKVPLFYLFLYCIFVILFILVFDFTNISYFSAYQKIKDVDPLTMQIAFLDLKMDPSVLDNNFSKLTSKPISFFGTGNDIYLIGSKLYTNLYVVFIALSFLLLIALIVSIIITDILRHSSVDKENSLKDLDSLDNIAEAREESFRELEEVINQPVNVKMKEDDYSFELFCVIAAFYVISNWKIYLLWILIYFFPITVYFSKFGYMIIFDLIVNWRLVLLVFDSEEVEKDLTDEKKIKKLIINFFSLYTIGWIVVLVIALVINLFSDQLPLLLIFSVLDLFAAREFIMYIYEEMFKKGDKSDKDESPKDK